MLDLYKFLVVRPQPLNLPVEEADLGVFRLDLSKTRKVRLETILNLRQERTLTWDLKVAPCSSSFPVRSAT